MQTPGLNSRRSFAVFVTLLFILAKPALGGEAASLTLPDVDWDFTLRADNFYNSNALNVTDAGGNVMTQPRTTLGMTMRLSNRFSCRLRAGTSHERHEDFTGENEDIFAFGEACRLTLADWRLSAGNLSELVYEPFYKRRTIERHNVFVILARDWTINRDPARKFGFELGGVRRFAKPKSFSRFAGYFKLSAGQKLHDAISLGASQRVEHRYFDKIAGSDRRDWRFVSALALNFEVNEFLTISPTIEFTRYSSNTVNRSYNRVEIGPVITFKFGS